MRKRKPNTQKIDWDAFGKWAAAHDEILRVYKKMPRKQLELINAIANFQADRATEWFLKAVEGMRSMRELAESAVSLLPAAKNRGQILGLLAAKQVQIQAVEDELRKRQRSSGGKETAKKLRIEAAARAKAIQDKATELLNKGRHVRDIPGILAAHTFYGEMQPYSRVTILKALKTHPGGEWPGREKQKKK